jgi:hypothetical protein
VGRRESQRTGIKRWNDFAESEDDAREEEKVKTKCAGIERRKRRMGEVKRW